MALSGDDSTKDRWKEYRNRNAYSLYSARKGAAYGAFAGFIGAIAFTGIVLSLPLAFGMPEGVFFQGLGLSIVDSNSHNPVSIGFAAFSIILIQGIAVGIVFGIVVSRVRKLNVYNRKRAVGFGLITGIIAFLVLYVPIVISVYPSLLAKSASSYPQTESSMNGWSPNYNMAVPSYAAYIEGVLGIGIVAYLLYGFVMGGGVGMAYAIYRYDQAKMTFESAT